MLHSFKKYKSRHRFLIYFQHVPAGENSDSWNFLTWKLPVLLTLAGRTVTYITSRIIRRTGQGPDTIML